MSATAQAVTESTAIPQLFLPRFSEAEYKRTVWVATTEGETKREHLTNPAYWAHVAAKMKPYDHIEVRSDDETFWAEYLVLACDRTWAKVQELRYIVLNKPATEQKEDPDFTVEWKGPHRKFAVVRKMDNAIMKEEFTNRTEANIWLTSYRQSMAR